MQEHAEICSQHDGWLLEQLCSSVKLALFWAPCSGGGRVAPHQQRGHARLQLRGVPGAEILLPGLSRGELRGPAAVALGPGARPKMHCLVGDKS